MKVASILIIAVLLVSCSKTKSTLALVGEWEMTPETISELKNDMSFESEYASEFFVSRTKKTRWAIKDTSEGLEVVNIHPDSAKEIKVSRIVSKENKIYLVPFAPDNNEVLELIIDHKDAFHYQGENIAVKWVRVE